MTQTWDPAAYGKDGAFVHQLAGGVFEWLAPQPDERILDLGCGDGQLTQRLIESGARVTAIDSSLAMVSAARSLESPSMKDRQNRFPTQTTSLTPSSPTPCCIGCAGRTK